MNTADASLENHDDGTEIERVFKRFDANGDGKISAAELGEVLRSLGTATSPEEIQRMMKEIDTDGDGYIDLKEFAELHRSNFNGSGGDGELRDAFDMYDLDKNGLISASELNNVLKKLGEICSEQDCSRMIRSVDSDGDGCVNFDEFKKMMSNGKASAI